MYNCFVSTALFVSMTTESWLVRSTFFSVVWGQNQSMECIPLWETSSRLHCQPVYPPPTHTTTSHIALWPSPNCTAFVLVTALQEPRDLDALFVLLESAFCLFRFHKGHCLVTIATGEMSEANADRAGLVPTHAYAMLDIRPVKVCPLSRIRQDWHCVHESFPSIVMKNDFNRDDNFSHCVFFRDTSCFNWRIPGATCDGRETSLRRTRSTGRRRWRGPAITTRPTPVSLTTVSETNPSSSSFAQCGLTFCLVSTIPINCNTDVDKCSLSVYCFVFCSARAQNVCCFENFLNSFQAYFGLTMSQFRGFTTWSTSTGIQGYFRTQSVCISKWCPICSGNWCPVGQSLDRAHFLNTELCLQGCSRHRSTSCTKKVHSWLYLHKRKWQAE